MEADHRHAPAGPQGLEARLEKAVEVLELAVDGDAQGLEDPRGRVQLAAPPADGRLDHPRQGPRGADPPAAPRGADRLGDLAALRLAAEVVEQVGQLAFAEAVDQLDGLLALAGVEAHIERAFVLERKAPLRIRELGRVDSQIQQHGIDRLDPPRFEHGGEVREVRFDQLERHIRRRREPPGGLLEHRRVEIEPEVAPVRREARQDRRGMTTEPDGPVEEDLTGPRLEEPDDLSEQDRFVHCISTRQAWPARGAGA